MQGEMGHPGVGSSGSCRGVGSCRGRVCYVGWDIQG